MLWKVDHRIPVLQLDPRATNKKKSRYESRKIVITEAQAVKIMPQHFRVVLN